MRILITVLIFLSLTGCRSYSKFLDNTPLLECESFRQETESPYSKTIIEGSGVLKVGNTITFEKLSIDHHNMIGLDYELEIYGYERQRKESSLTHEGYGDAEEQPEQHGEAIGNSHAVE